MTRLPQAPSSRSGAGRWASLLCLCSWVGVPRELQPLHLQSKCLASTMFTMAAAANFTCPTQQVCRPCLVIANGPPTPDQDGQTTTWIFVYRVSGGLVAMQRAHVVLLGLLHRVSEGREVHPMKLVCPLMVVVEFDAEGSEGSE